MAQDFYRAFLLGNTDKGISTLDTSGVALVAVRALMHENLEKDTEITELKSQITSMQKEFIEHKALKQQLALVLELKSGVQLTLDMSE